MRVRDVDANRACPLARAIFMMALAAAPSTHAVAQTFGAQQAVRRSVEGLGEPAPDRDRGAPAASSATVSYEREVLPVLRANCHGCHRAAKTSGGLEMTSFENLLRGGESGSPAIVAGRPDDSYLVQQITPERGKAAMPKGRRSLPASQIALIRRWIEEGAVDDRSPGNAAAPDAYRNERSVQNQYSSGMIDTTFVAPTAIAVVALRPAQILSAPIAELLPTEVISAAGNQYLGFDPASIEEVIAFVGPINLMGPMEYGLTIKFSAPFRAVSINRELRAHAQLGELAGKRYLQSASPSPLQPSFYGPDNRTLVIAPDASLRRLIQAKDQPQGGPIVDRVRATPAGSDLYVAVDAASLRPLAEMGVAQAKATGRVPPQAQTFLELPKLLSAVELTFNITPAGPMSLVLHAQDEVAAGKIEAMFAGRANQDESRTRSYEAASDDPVAQALMQYTQRIAQPFQPQRAGNDVTLFHVEAQSQAHQQLASLAVFGIGVGLQVAQNARTAAQQPPTSESTTPLESAPPAGAPEFAPR